jgi:hypothetical protein
VRLELNFTFYAFLLSNDSGGGNEEEAIARIEKEEKDELITDWSAGLTVCFCCFGIPLIITGLCLANIL